MASLLSTLIPGIKPTNGELTINLNLTIKIEADGSLSVLPAVTPTTDRVSEKKDNKTEYELPDLDVGESDIINFGKNV